MKTIVDVRLHDALTDHIDNIVVFKDASIAEAGSAKASVATPFQNAAWLASWQHHVGPTLQCTPLRAVACKDGAVVMDLSLVLKRAFGVRVLAWQADEINDYCGPVAAPSLLASLSEQSARVLLRLIAEAAGGVDAIRLQKQLQHYGALRNPFVGATAIPYHVDSHAVTWANSWTSHYAENRSAKTRRRINDKLRALQKRGRLSMRFSEHHAEARELVARGLEMKSVQLTKAGHWNPFAAEATRNHLIAYFGDHITDETWVAVLELDGQPLAISFGFRHAEGWLLYQIAMTDGPHSKFSPGTHLLLFLIDSSSKAGAHHFDLSIGNEMYKHDWCNVSRVLMSDVFAMTMRGSVVARYIRLTDHVRLAIATRPWMYVRAKRLLNTLKPRRAAPTSKETDD
jgi:CelD/BcsL family acetyltransferase involved in cellulose biosynthesis